MTEWQSIETAPTEQDVLVYRADAGVMIGRITSLSEVATESEIEKLDITDEQLHENCWFIGSPIYSCEILEGDYIPTHWMPLPKEPK